MLVLALSFAAAPAAAQNPVELGRVRWGRDLEAGFAETEKSGRPVFLLFQEIPGCQTCQDFGSGPLSHPLLVEAMESEFVPVAIYNNIEGRDAEILKRYEEPSWNNPVFRFFAADGAELLPRHDRLWSSGEVAGRMVEALRAAKRPVPPYLALAAEETAAKPTREATFVMHCYWEGEAALGNVPGVLATEAGWVGDKEVVRVTYRPDLVAEERLVEAASAGECALLPGEDRPRRAKDSDQLYYLLNSPYRLLPLTPLQSLRVNAALGTQGDAERWLSPRQRELAKALRAALAADPEFGADLARPSTVSELYAFERNVRARLG